MFGFGKKNKENKMVKGVVGYTMHTIANMTRLDPTQLPDDLRDKILQYTLTKAEDVDDKYDFCANYMIAFALFLDGLAKGQNSAGWQEKADRALQAAIDFVNIEQSNINKKTQDQLSMAVDLLSRSKK